MFSVKYSGSHNQYVGLLFSGYPERWAAFSTEPWTIKNSPTRLMSGGYQGILCRAPDFAISLI